MRCIFCKEPSDSSLSVEHIIPESLGNTLQVLPPGIVCDRCNNYFARKVEAPFLNEGTIRALRFHQGVRNKRKRIPPLDAIFMPGKDASKLHDITIARREGISFQLHSPPPPTTPDQMLALSLPAPAAYALVHGEGGAILFPDTWKPPADVVVTRFLAKCAIEAFAQRLLRAGLDCEPFVDYEPLDDLRNHARLGSPKQWSYSIRRIYDTDRMIVGAHGESLQTMYEYDLFFTNPDNVLPDGSIHSEIYFVLALFGLELALNLGGPEIDGYQEWLRRNDNKSPLYPGENEVP